MKTLKSVLLFLLIFGSVNNLFSQNVNKFKQLKEELATPNIYRTASGAPGPNYYQQKANYDIKVILDDENQTINGEELVTYINNSPDPLTYIWLQLDQNRRDKNTDTDKIKSSKLSDKMSTSSLANFYNEPFDGGFNITKVSDVKDQNLTYVINKTMMRINLPKVLRHNDTLVFKVEWNYSINDRMLYGGRSGYEYFKDEDNYIYTIAQFFPRMCVYNDVEGWQNKQFLGGGEFALPFGDYKVAITVPEDHIVSGTGELMNANNILSKTQLHRFDLAKTTFDNPVMIVNESEAKKTEKKKMKSTKTWVFEADSVRDFAFASSRKFIWDAMAVDINGKTVMAMSFYPKEGNPLWEQYSTRVTAHTIKTYSKYTIDYPYPVAQSVNSKKIGMEYPMICFNFGRPEKDGTYSMSTKYGVIGVIIHEVGHNFFPMIINSDERQWTWMDEGLNTFVQYLTEQEWETDYPSRRGPAYKITSYMKGDKNFISPIMTNSESILQFGNNAYGKPATALNILRETIMGPELFDYSLKTYSERWAFKHPTPADFFRTMEDASAVDLDWFWRGWFYTTDNVDIAISNVNWMIPSTMLKKNAMADLKTKDEDIEAKVKSTYEKSKALTYADEFPVVNDFYNTEYDPYFISKADLAKEEAFYSKLSKKELAAIEAQDNFYEMTFENLGGLVMPILLTFTFEDGSSQEIRLPAEVWLKNNYQFTKVFKFSKKVKEIELDKYLETADVDRENNYWPKRNIPSRFELYKAKERKSLNPMQIQQN